MVVRPSAAPRIVFFLSLLLLPWLSGPVRAAGDYTIGVVPQMPPVAMYTNWTPLIEHLNRKSGLSLKLKVYENMDEFERDFLAGNPDLIFSSPAQIVLARQAQGYIPLVRNSRRIKGVLYVRRDSPIREVNQLQGKNIAFVGMKSLCSIIVRHRLGEHPATITYNSIYSGSSENVYKSVILGRADAGATLEMEIGEVSPEVSKLLRPLMTSQEINPHPLSAHPRVPEEVRRTIREAVLHLQGDEKGQELLRRIRLPSPVAADYARDYQNIEEIALSSAAQEL